MAPRTRLLVAAALVVASCTSSSEPASTVATSTTATTSTTAATTTPPPPTSSSTTTMSVPHEASFPEYRIAERIISPETGDTVVLLLDPASYTSLSDLDLYDVIADVVDRFPSILEVHVVDSQDAVSVVLVEEPGEGQQKTLEAHYFVRLEDGFRIVYVGPFEGVDDAILGS